MTSRKLGSNPPQRIRNLQMWEQNGVKNHSFRTLHQYAYVMRLQSSFLIDASRETRVTCAAPVGWAEKGGKIHCGTNRDACQRLRELDGGGEDYEREMG
jgi:hypothetical protein